MYFLHNSSTCFEHIYLYIWYFKIFYINTVDIKKKYDIKVEGCLFSKSRAASNWEKKKKGWDGKKLKKIKVEGNMWWLMDQRSLLNNMGEQVLHQKDGQCIRGNLISHMSSLISYAFQLTETYIK